MSATPTMSSLLAEAWVELGLSTLVATWQKANPGEAAALSAYALNGGTPPSLATHVGKAMVLIEQALRLAAQGSAVSVLPPSQ